ncbi:YggS family pyridoxal phosphate-dependent enzyme [Elusimicrobiota bacterium]
MIESNIKSVIEKVSNACSRSSRDVATVRLVVVTKTIGAESVREALAFGITDIGESRIQEAEPKLKSLEQSLVNVKKHLIGHLQRNKAKKAVEIFDLIQSLDSVRLAEEINKQAEKSGKIQDCLIEIKVSDEETKLGLNPQKVIEILSKIENLKNIRILGLMTMAPFFDDAQQTRPYFKKAKILFDEICSLNKYPEFTILSMGMSNDFEVAIEEGSNMVRVGTAIFK